MSRQYRLISFLASAAVMVASSPAFGQLLAQERPSPPAAQQGVTIGPEGPVVPAPPAGQRPQPSPNEPQVFKLTVTPAAEPVPPLKYRFSVPSNERQPGNSVPFYYRALVQLGSMSAEDKTNRAKLFERVLDLPATELPKEEVRALLARYEYVFKEIDRAAVREETDWDWRLEELGGMEAIGFLLPEIQESRELARLLKLKAQLEIAEGRFGDAAKTLRNGYALAEAVAEPPTLINDLVGIAITSILGEVVREWAGMPGSPNLYWAVTSLPDPPIDLRPALEYELALPYRFAPWLATAETDDAGPEVWRDRLAAGFRDLQELEPLMRISAPREPKADATFQVALALLAVRNYPAAKRELIALGHDAGRVEAMPVGQVLAIWQKHVTDTIAQHLLKETFLPAAAADEVGREAERYLKDKGYFGGQAYWQGGETVPFMALLAPATRQAGTAVLRMETLLAGLRTIEAVRMHAAATGALPKSLDEVKAVPVPDNPRTGRPFDYKVVGETAILEIVREPEQPRVNWRVELTLKK